MAKINGITDAVSDLEDEFYRLLDEGDPDIDDCLKIIHRLQHFLIAFETRVRNHRDLILIQKLQDLEQHVRDVGFNVADTVFKPPICTD